jgi:hypothetical protein
MNEDVVNVPQWGSRRNQTDQGVFQSIAQGQTPSSPFLVLASVPDTS